MASWRKIVADGASLTDIGTPASTDKVLIQDVTDGVIKYVDWSDVTSGGGGGITDIVQDTSPQLGGHLETNGYSIRMNTNNVGIQGTNTNSQLVDVIRVDANDAILISGGTDIDLNGLVKWNAALHTTTNTTSTSGSYGEGAEIILHGTNSNTTAGRVYGLTSSNAWAGHSPASESAVSPLIGVATGSSSSKGIVIRGIVTVDVYNSTAGTTTLTIGAPVYANTNGSVTNEAPTTSGYFQRILGHAVATNKMFFNPSPEYIEIA